MRKTLLNTMGLVLALFGATNASAQETFPYSVDFLTASDLSGWTAIDKSETPGVTWEFGMGTYSAEKGAYVTAARMPEDNSSVHNDYLVSPAFTLTKGYTYTINVTGQFKGSALCGFQEARVQRICLPTPLSATISQADSVFIITDILITMVT